MKQNILVYSTLLLITLFYYGCAQNNHSKNNILQPKNIILMIGDGMGLSQITAAMYSKGNGLNLEEAKYIGLIKTNSASSIITDSAAGATAFSSSSR